MGYSTVAAKPAVVLTCSKAATSVVLATVGAITETSPWPVCE